MKLLKIIKYLDYNFISVKCILHLSDLSYKEITSILRKFEEYCILKLVKSNESNGIAFNKIIIDNIMKNIPQDDCLDFVFNKIEKMLLNNIYSSDYYHNEYYFHLLNIEINVKKHNYNNRKYAKAIENIKKILSNEYQKKDKTAGDIKNQAVLEESKSFDSENSSIIDENFQNSGNKIESSQLVLELQNELGINYFNKGDYKNAVKYFKNALKMVQKSPVNINTKFSILNFVFKSYLNYGKYQKAIDFCNENIKILINYCKKEELASLNNDLGLAFSNLAKNKKSIELYNLSLKLDIDDINPSKAVSYYRMANAYYFIDNFKEAELNIYKSLTLLKDLAVPEHLANAYLVEAMIMVKLNSANIDKAIEKCHKSLELYRSIYADNQNKDENNICFANAFYCLGNFWWKKK